MDDVNIVTAVIIFFTYVAIDMLYAWYVLAVSSQKALQAASLGAALYSLCAFGVMTYSKNMFYILPLACGSFLGTYLTIKLHKYFNTLKK